MDGSWHWPHLMEALQKDAGLQQVVEKAMHEHKLQWELYVWDDGGMVARVWASQEGLLRESQDGVGQQTTALPEFITRLRGLEVEKWADLYLCTYVTKEAALAAGQSLVDPVAEVFRALLPLYEASTRQGRFSG